jgi:GntR family transcriptional repressor for pyruvate dehydrogenase complex
MRRRYNLAMNPSTTALLPARKKYRNLAQGVVEELSTRIRQGEFNPGDKLPPEAAIMEAYGVSRTVVREAISQLQAGGLVQTRHGIGTFVLTPPQTGLGLATDTVVTVRDVLAILELRISMETEAAWLAASRRSDEQVVQMGEALADMARAFSTGRTSVEADVRFHQLIAEATGNRYFVDLLGQLGNAIIPRSRVNTPADYLERVQREHEDIYKAIGRRDPEAARAAMRTHLSNSRERLREAQQRLQDHPA